MSSRSRLSVHQLVRCVHLLIISPLHWRICLKQCDGRLDSVYPNTSIRRHQSLPILKNGVLPLQTRASISDKYVVKNLKTPISFSGLDGDGAIAALMLRTTFPMCLERFPRAIGSVLMLSQSAALSGTPTTRASTAVGLMKAVVPYLQVPYHRPWLLARPDSNP